MKNHKKRQGGYTLIELMLTVAILAIVASITYPHFDLTLQKANQSKARGDLGNVRSGLSLYYSAEEGNWPLQRYPQGWNHYNIDGLSLTTILVPQYMPLIPTPKVLDRMNTFNGVALNYDSEAEKLMAMDPPKDVVIVWGNPAYTPGLVAAYAYDNQEGILYYPNGNLDLTSEFFFRW